jgi:hypothetical protein
MPDLAPNIDHELTSFITGEIDPKAFPHREHLRFSYEMLARHTFAETVSLFSGGLRKLACKAGKPELYHDTMTVAFLSLIAERRAAAAYGSFDSFIAANPDLLEKNVLERWYDKSRLQSNLARRNFILPKAIDLTGYRNLKREVTAYTAIYVVLITCASAVTIWKAFGHAAPIVWLGLAEMSGAGLFIFAGTRFIGLIVLLLVFSIATVADSFSGNLPVRFLIYAASAILLWRLRDACVA